jgi:hypothetical protein
VPDTGGATISNSQIQQLINLWATDATVGDGTDDTQASIAITNTSVDGSNVTVSWDGTAATSSDHIHVQLDDQPYVGGQPIDGSYTFENVTPGEHTVSVAVADTGHNEYQNPEASDSTTVTVPTQETGGELVAAINAGGSAYTASDGTEYQADTYFDGGETTSAGQAGIPADLEINGTEDDPLYLTERYGDPFGYDVPVGEDGTYEVTLQFAEIYQGVSSNDAPDSSGPSDGTNENDRVFNASIEGEQVLSEYDLFATVGPATATEQTYTVEVTDGTLNVDFEATADNAKLSALTVTKVDDAAGGDDPADGEATLAIDAGQGVEATTWDAGSYEITNTGDKEIQTVTLDLRSAVFPDIVFDPDGTAGDAGQKGFEPSSGSSTVGLVGGSVSIPHNGINGSDGYDKLTIEFDDFQPGESFAFAIDNDPTSIKGASSVQSGEAGPISGLELTGSAMTATFADGETVETDLFGDGSAGGSQGVADATTAAAPTIGADGVSLAATNLSPDHTAATVSSTEQTITVDGTPGETATLLRVEGELNLDGVPTYDGTTGYDLQAYEANTALDVEQYTATIGSDGTAQIPVTLTNSSSAGGLNYFVAAGADADGELGMASNVVVLEYDASADDGSDGDGSGDSNAAPTIDAVANQTVSEGASTTVPVNVSDADGDAVSLSLSAPDFVSLSNSSLTIAPQSGDAADSPYTVTLTADDGNGGTATESFQVVVEAADTGGELVAAINAGGSAYTAADGTVYEADSANAYYSSGTKASSTTLSIDGTEDDSLYQSERFGDGDPFSYDVPVPENGTYEVTLHFAEIWHTNQTGGAGDDAGAAGEVGDRVFSVNLEGGSVELESYDIYADVGGLTATQKTYTTEVTDGTLNVDFTFTADNAKISAIEITKVDSGSTGDSEQ